MKSSLWSDKFIPVCEPALIGKESEYVQDCLRHNWISSSGKYIEKFEKGFAEFCSVKYGVAVCNGTVSLHIALEALGIGPGDEVIIPDFTMIGSVNAILYTGARPVVVDVDKETWCIDPGLISEKITQRTKAIMPVHIYGHPCDMDEINQIAKDHNLFVIEDAAEAHGALYKGRKTGSLSDAASFSFYANKIITTGEGGMVVTNDEEIVERARLLRNHAFTKTRFLHKEVGYNYRFTNIQAAIGLAQLENINKFVETRIRNAQRYDNLLQSIEGIITPPCKDWAKNVYWMYGILLDGFGMSRDALGQELLKRGVETRPFFVPLSQQPMFVTKSRKFDFPAVNGDCPVSAMLGRNGLYLPSSNSLTNEDVGFVVDAIKEIKKGVVR